MRFLFILIILAASQFAYSGTRPTLVQESAHNLRPTQAVIGMIEVNDKADEFLQMSREERMEYLADHPVPVIIGPGNRYYMIDRHHMCRALVESGHKKLFIQVIGDWSKMSLVRFWQKMENMQNVYLYDSNGKKTMTPKNLPTHISELKDDPYRSLSYYARKAGAYQKSESPFSEFHWANFYRNYITFDDLTNWNRAIQKAIRISMIKEAAVLPGYRGRYNSCAKIFNF